MYSNPSWNLNSESWYSLLLALVRYLFATVHVGVTAQARPGIRINYRMGQRAVARLRAGHL